MSARLMALRGSNNEGVLAAVLVVLIVAMSLVSPSFFTVGTLFAVSWVTFSPVRRMRGAEDEC